MQKKALFILYEIKMTTHAQLSSLSLPPSLRISFSLSLFFHIYSLSISISLSLLDRILTAAGESAIIAAAFPLASQQVGSNF